MIRRGPISRCAVVACLAVMSLARADVASANEEIGLSRDGVTFTATLTQPLFDPTIRWVPGDVRTAAYYVRNESPNDATVAIDVTGSGGLIGIGDLTVAARSGGTHWRAATTVGTHRLVTEQPLAAGDVLQVELSIAFDAASSNASQGQSYEFSVSVTLVGDVPVPGAPEGTPPPGATIDNTLPTGPIAPPPSPAPTPPIPGTGATLTRPLALAAGFCVVAGVTVTGAARRRHSHA